MATANRRLSPGAMRKAAAVAMRASSERALRVEQGDAQGRGERCRSSSMLRITPSTASAAWPSCSVGSARHLLDDQTQAVHRQADGGVDARQPRRGARHVGAEDDR